MTLADLITDAIRDELVGRDLDLDDATITAIAQNIVLTLRDNAYIEAGA